MYSENQKIPNYTNPASSTSYGNPTYSQDVNPSYSYNPNYPPQSRSSNVPPQYSPSENSYSNPNPNSYTNYPPPNTEQSFYNQNLYQNYFNRPQNEYNNPGPVSYTQIEPPNQNYTEYPQNDYYPYKENDTPLLPQTDYTYNNQLSGAYSSLTPEQSQLIKDKLSSTTSLKSYTYKLLKLSELIKVQAQQKDFKRINLENFVVISDVDTAVETTSNGWIKLEVMKKFGLYSPDFVECIDLLSTKYHISGWKKSRGDGNCYYRAVMIRYFDIIFGVYSLISNVNYFLGILTKLKDFSEKSFEFDFDYKSALEHVIYYTNELKKQKESDPYYTYNYLNYFFQNKDADLNLVRVSRMLTYMGLINRASEYADFGMNITENYSAMILNMGEEAQEFVLMLLPLELGIKVIQYNLFNKIHIETFPDESEKSIIVHIVRRGGHYDILYTNKESEHDMFDFSCGTFHYFQSS